MNFDPLFVARHLARLFAALYASEGWNATWQINGGLYRKARSIVVYDRVLNDAFPALEGA